MNRLIEFLVVPILFPILFPGSLIIGAFGAFYYKLDYSECSPYEYERVREWVEETPELSLLVDKHLLDNKLLSWEYRDIDGEHRQICKRKKAQEIKGVIENTRNKAKFDE